MGRVAFLGAFGTNGATICDDKVLLSGNVVPIEIATGGTLLTNCSFRILNTNVPIALNDQGGAAFVGDFAIPSGSGSAQAVFVDGSVVWEERTPGFGVAPVPGTVALNDANTVAFKIDSGPTGHGDLHRHRSDRRQGARVG